MKTINFIQDEATPHNNILIKNLNAISNESKLQLWYALEKSNQYDWDIDLTHEVLKANIYGTKINFRLIKYYLQKARSEIFLMVGWSNPTTRIIYLLAVLMGFKLFMWFDLPDEKKERNWVNLKIRNVFYYLLKKSKIQLFCAGKMTVDYFLSKGFPEQRLHNLPVQVEVVRYKPLHPSNGALKLFAGSRLIYDKGFDLLLAALANLPERCKVNLRLAGTGPEKEALEAQVEKLELDGQVDFIGWVSPSDYQKELEQSDVFIHPARVDAYGATVLALASGTPVIGSSKAGAVIDCLVDGENGYVYPPESIDKLTALILSIYDNRDLIRKFSSNALLIANKCDGKYWAKQVIKVTR